MDTEPPPSSTSSGSDTRWTETYHRGRKPWATVGATVAVLAGVAWACLRFRPSRIAIEGPSMAPTLLPGDWALTVTPRSFRRGDVVVLEHPDGFEIVKRITGVPGDVVEGRTLGVDEWWVQGDREASSSDSRHFGPVAGHAIRTRVAVIYWPVERRRPVR